MFRLGRRHGRLARLHFVCETAAPGRPFPTSQHAQPGQHGTQLCDAVAHLHHHPRSPIAHLDIKPDNILLQAKTNRDGAEFNLKLADLGVAQAVPPTLDESVLRHRLFDSRYLLARYESQHLPFWYDSDKLLEQALKLDVWAVARVLLDIASLQVSDQTAETEEEQKSEVSRLLESVGKFYSDDVVGFFENALASMPSDQMSIVELKLNLTELSPAPALLPRSNASQSSYVELVDLKSV